MTKEQRKISKENRKKAAEYFGIDKAGKYEYDLHHINPDWKENDIERYIQWNPEDLVVLTHAEHARLHNTRGNHQKSEEHDYKFSDQARANIAEGAKAPKTDKWKKAHSESMKGRHYYNNGIYEVCVKECPEGFVKGKLIKK